MTAISLERRVEIETPEQTILSYTLAGVGSRAAAALVDLFIILVAQFVLFLLIQQIGSAARSHVASAQRTSGAWAYAVGALVAYALMWGYYVFFEAIWDGQTPGKRWLDIRVVQDGGYSVSFGASAVRNLVRLLDLQPAFLYGVGLVSMTVSKSGKRLGDIAAGTIVVHEQRALIAAAVRSAPEAASAPAITSRLTEEEFALLGRFIGRRTQLDRSTQSAFTLQLATRFQQHLPTDVRGPSEQLARLFEMESDSRARGLPSPGAKGAARERHAIVAINAERWRDFSTALTTAQRRGLRSMSPQQVSELVSLYREVSTDLARLRTASDSEDQDAIFYVSRLLGAGHNFLYRQRGLSTRDVWRYLSVAVPREVRRSRAYILAGAFFLFAPMVITYSTLVRHPNLESRLNPAGMIDRVVEDAHNDSAGKHAYISIKDYMRPVMASSIIANNVQVTYAVFAFGVAGCVLTILALVNNGISIGAAFALYTNHGVFHLIRDFVIAHSVLELSAICIAAGGGLLVGMALVLPGARTRREAFVINGRRAIRLITASTLMLLAAGTIEGLISPRTDIPFAVKAGVAASTALLLAFWFSRGRGDEEESPAEEFAYSEPRALSSR
ncbi:MAG TPA: stage II sporulation protein M [Gemmatimonadaceae bacterium]|nr:stage II sporulation protein M [Gemmatimonadaceae bacterium]